MTEIPLLDDEDEQGSDGDLESAAMMAAMGFSGFGMQKRPAKKRKFDPDASGANTAPLGERRRPAPVPAAAAAAAAAHLPARPLRGGEAEPTTSRGTDEIDLEDEDVDDDGVGGNDAEGGGSSSNSKPSTGALPPPAPASALATRRAATAAAAAGQKRPWWEGYYDAQMNENPWEKLERERGLEPRGTWLERGAARRGPGERAAAAGRQGQGEGAGAGVGGGNDTSITAAVEK